MPRILVFFALIIGFVYLSRTLKRIAQDKRKCPKCHGKGYTEEGIRAYRTDCRFCDAQGYL